MPLMIQNGTTDYALPEANTMPAMESKNIFYKPDTEKGVSFMPSAAIEQSFHWNNALWGAMSGTSSMPIPGTTLGGGAAAGGLGSLNVQDIILTIERPIRYQPNDYAKLIGYPTDKAVKLGSLQGFAVVKKCHLRCAATLAEQELIMEHFAQGVIF